MRRLHASGAFRSLTYRDMPFVLAPGLWRRMAGREKRRAACERAHGDGVAVSVDSPEGLEEVFWRVFCGRDYIHATHLSPHAPSQEVIQAYRAYVAALLSTRPPEGVAPRYLSKNNNNILRLPAILAAFPDATVLVPFREPLAHAESLRRQHLRFCDLQARDRFAERYMDWLAHHEFGHGHRPFWFDAAAPFAASHRNAATLDYWLELWCRTYEWLLGQRGDRIVLVSYDRLCAEPGLWRRVADLVEAPPPSDGTEELERRSRSGPGSADTALAHRAQTIHASLLARSPIE